MPIGLILMVVSWGLITVVLLGMLLYRAKLARREDDSLKLRRAKYADMGGELETVVAKLNWLRRPIITLTTMSGTLLLASASVWAWTEFASF